MNPALLLTSLMILFAQPDKLSVDLNAPSAAENWYFEEPTAEIRDGELICDGTKHVSRAIFLPREWEDVSLQARFLVEPADTGVLACGFMVRASDAASYYYVHFDRTQAILVRSDPDNGWIELRRVGNLDKPAGQWHEGRLEAIGDTLKVYLNGVLLYEHQDKHLVRGRVGFYANEGRAHVKDITVEGAAQEPGSKLSIPPRSFTYVCEDGGAGGYEAFPDVCRLSDGRLMAVCYAGYTHVSLPCERLPQGGRIVCCTSNDEGQTWSEPTVVHDGPHDDRDPSIVQLSSGRLICNFFSLGKSDDPNQPWIGYGSWMVTSDDGGRNWSAPSQITPDAYCSSPIRELSDGRLILGLYRETNGSAHGAIIYSDDQAKSWSRIVDIDNGGHRLDAETDIIRLKDGRLLAAQRPTMCSAISDDCGATWSVSQPMGFEGHCPYFLRTADDIILLAHRLPSTSLHYSLDEGQTWSANVPVDQVIGAYPSMVNLKDGSVLIVYYEEGAASSIRAKRFRVTPAGVEWLPFELTHAPAATN